MNRKVVGIAMLFLALSAAIAAVFLADKIWLQILLAMLAIILAGSAFFYFVGNKMWKKTQRSSIQRLVLINSDGEKDKEWAVAEAASLLIGKGSRDHFVDVDLSDNRYADYIASSHAVLNRIGTDWYVEDLETVNGVGIKKRGDDNNYRIQPNRPYKIDVGDILYIAKVRLLAK